MILSRSYRIGKLGQDLFALQRQQHRSASISKAIAASPVLVSANKDIYTNLALEHWIYNNLKYSKKNSTETKEHDQDSKTFNRPTVLIWTDEPSIVIGRHQNPWIETTLGLVNRLGIKLARRHSGGGCVYHDESNINISIIGNRDLFEDRQANLRFLAQVLKEKYGVECEPNKRHDLIHSKTGLKISGSAAKLGRTNCYHHFTLLVDTDKEIMQAVIRRKPQEFIKTNSSPSARNSVINLKEIKSDISVEQVISDLSQAYNKHYTNPNIKRPSSKESPIEGDKEEFEKLNKAKLDLEDPNWIYALTPKFKMEQKVDWLDGGERNEAKMMVQINRGKFESIEIECDSRVWNLSHRFQPLIGTEFSYQESMINAIKAFELDQLDSKLIVPNAHEQIFATLLLKMIQEAHF